MAERDSAVALVTGSTKGIGLAIAEALVARGDHVVISGRGADDAREVAARLSERGPGDAAGIGCDVRDADACGRLVERTVDRFGTLDLLVNNAGLGRFVKIQEMTTEDWDIQIRTNLDGVFHCSKAAIPHLVTSEGWIVNIASLASRNTFSGGVGYNASKWGVLGMTEAMMLDLRHEGVRVSCIMPGSVNTDFFEGGPDPSKDWMLRAEDIAHTIVDLLEFPPRALPSRIEIRPSRPPQK